jgi:restriction system protein
VQAAISALAPLAPLFACIVLVIWCVAEFKKWDDRRRLEGQTGPSSIQTLSWQQFESLLAEAFRRQGFVVEHTGSHGADDGVDLRLSKAGAKTLVQCKHWKVWRVGVKVVRELLGVVASEGAQAGIVVTSGRFTRDAIAFANKSPIRLIAAAEIVALIASVQRSGFSHPAGSHPACSSPGVGSAIVSDDLGRCPECGAKRVRRVAKQGKHAGSPFLGCSRYPECRCIQNLAPTNS